MHPGGACIDCHLNPWAHGLHSQGPATALAGTVYGSGHETDDCFGIDGSITLVTVEVTDANGAFFPMVVGQTGNFVRAAVGPSASVAYPLHALVRAGDRVRPMKGAIPHGDCNACHTVLGANGAPGRIVAP